MDVTNVIVGSVAAGCITATFSFVKWTGNRIIIKPLDELIVATHENTKEVVKLRESQNCFSGKIETIEKDLISATKKIEEHDKKIKTIEETVTNCQKDVGQFESRMKSVETILMVGGK